MHVKCNGWKAKTPSTHVSLDDFFPLFQKLQKYKFRLIPLTFICFSFSFFSLFTRNQSVENISFRPNRLHIKSHFLTLIRNPFFHQKRIFPHAAATVLHKMFDGVFTPSWAPSNAGWVQCGRDFSRYIKTPSHWWQRWKSFCSNVSIFKDFISTFATYFVLITLKACVNFIIFYVTVKCYVFNLFDCWLEEKKRWEESNAETFSSSDTLSVQKIFFYFS